MAEDFHNLPFRLVPFIPVACQLHYYFMPVYRAFRTLFRHKNISADFTVIWNNKAKRCRLLIGSYNLACAVLQYLADCRLLPFAPFARQQFHLHPVQMKSIVDHRLRNI